MTTLANTSQESDLSNASMEEFTPKKDLNSSKEKLEDILGPRKKGPIFVICMSTVYIVILLCGLIGNISTCFVVIYNNCMHTTTNYYLFSLAVSDVLSLLFGLPPELYSIMIEAYPWAFGETFCVVRTFIFETTTIASVLTILTFTFERWLHICKAIYAKQFSSGFSRVLKIILFIWVLSGLLALPYAFMTGVYLEEDKNPISKTCNIPKEYKHYMKNVIQLSVIFLFIVPMTLISIMYILIGVTLWKSQSRHKAGSYMSHQSSCSKKENKFTSKFNRKFRKKDTKISFGLKSQNCKNLVEANLVNNDTLLPRNASQFSVGDIRNVSLYAYERTSKEFEHISYRARQSRRDVVKMLFVVVLSFFTCWAPYHCQRVMTTLLDPSQSKLLMKILEYLFYISGISIYISSTMNPILYNVMSKRYRTAFRNTLKMISTCNFTTKTNQGFKNSAYHSSINFNNIKHPGSRRNQFVT
ncbi:neuromedin-U receptor 2-like [Brachionus plicatilis]|uniref:Neuromedin-U receptor 2-like n=1 Tax=Brachionus plicatilis TaxID=10195 RepID=A0A3M7SH25_BRAPC|nr:neuromedin-U receptor 2-like [Brachionus plicatilis]